MNHRARPHLAAAMVTALGVSTLVLGPAGATDDDSLVYVIGGDITSLNNAADDGSTMAVNQWLYNGLYAYDEHLRPVPDIAAELAEVSDDGTVWTVRLRDDVYFQPTGERLTSEDVVFTYQLAMSEHCGYNPAACLAFVTVTPDGVDDPVPVLQAVEALDDLTVRFTLADTYAPFSTRILPWTDIESKTATMAHSSNCTTEKRPDTWNYICFRDERADELIEAGSRELDQAVRTEIYHEFEAILAEELPHLWGWSEVTREGLDADIHGAEPWTEEVMSSPTWFWELEKVNKGGFAAPD